ncbi:hypothetical protein [Sphingobacterium multivorum]|uniref:hypothetical protein n=1 Tax=Sphingobacterium multivorum TaxID=28454 RepID=UPI0031B9CB7C
MKRKLFIISSLSLAMSWCFGQSPSMPKQIIGPSPTVSNFVQYKETPVNLYSGMVNVSIPLYTIKVGELEIPISLDYKGGGIKVSEIASNCGLGWNLTTGGVVSRSTVGLPDETPKVGYLYSTYFESFSSYNEVQKHTMGTGSTDGEPDNFYFSFPGGSGRFNFDRSGNLVSIPKTNYQFIKGPELFYSSSVVSPATLISTRSIKDDRGNLYNFNDAEMGEVTGNRLVNFNTTGSGSVAINSWHLSKITTPVGDQVNYTYEEVPVSYDLAPTETINAKTMGSEDPLPPSIESYSRNVIKTKRISSISFRGGKVLFKYNSTSRADLVGDFALEEVQIFQGSTLIKSFQLNYLYLDGPNLKNRSDYPLTGETNFLTNTSLAPSATMSRRLVLESVRERSETGQFMDNGHRFEYIHNFGLPNRSSRSIDFWGYYNGNTEPKIIAQQSAQDAGLVDFFWYDRHVNTEYAIQGLLSKIINPMGGVTEFSYESNSIAASPKLPVTFTEMVSIGASVSFAHSLYGKIVYEDPDDGGYPYVLVQKDGQMVKNYYREFVLPERNNYTITIQNMPNVYGIYFYLFDVGRNRTVQTFMNDYGGLINLDAGIYRLYISPSLSATVQSPQNPYYNTFMTASVTGYKAYTKTLNSSGPTGNIVGGVRIKEQKIYDPLIGQYVLKEYKYRDPDGGVSGVLLNAPEFSYSKEASSSGSSISKYKVLTFDPVIGLRTTSGSYVAYSNVEEWTKSGDLTALGRVDYSYINANTNDDVFFTPAVDYSGFMPPYNLLPNPPVDNRDWLRGRLLSKSIYSASNQLLEKEINTYDYYLENTNVRGYKIDFYIEVLNGTSNYYYNKFDYKTGYLHLKESTKTVYNQAPSTNVEVNNRYIYSKVHLQPLAMFQNQSNGDSTATFYTYPKDFQGGNTSIANLIANNILINPIERITAVKKQSSYFLKEGELNIYRSAGNGLLERKDILETDVPISLASFKFSNRVLGVLPTEGLSASYGADARYKPAYSFLQYNTSGNPLELKVKELPVTVYLWGYNNQYPVLEIKNATYAEVATALTQAAIDNLNSISQTEATMETLIKNAADKLRTDIPKAMVTSFTYKPLVGMTSKTDARGIKETYTYDGMQRLQAILDHLNNVNRSFDYHYRSN